MSRRKTAEQKLVEAIHEMGIVKAESVFQALKLYNQGPEIKRKPKLVKAETAG